MNTLFLHDYEILKILTLYILLLTEIRILDLVINELSELFFFIFSDSWYYTISSPDFFSNERDEIDDDNQATSRYTIDLHSDK